MTEPTSGLKIIHHNAVNLDRPDDPSFPFKLEATLRPPEFMGFAFALLHGGEEKVIVRGMTREVLDGFIEEKLRKHPRLIQITITKPDGNVEKIEGSVR